MAELTLGGIHHLTAITADAPGNVYFYTKVLGMRLVKKTVNQDDTSAYHLFYADKLASPGSDLTFFDWARIPQEQRGNRSISRTSLRVAGEGTLQWWVNHLDHHHISHGPIVERGGRQVLDFDDPETQRLSLVDDGGQGSSNPWEGSPIPAERQIRGLGPVTVSVPSLQATNVLLTRVMNMRQIGEYPHPINRKDSVFIYEMGPGGAGAELHIAVQPELRPGRQGAGGVHHVAFRTPSIEEHHEWTNLVNTFGIPNSGEVERYYFRSLYFREPSGVLFEIATDGPGFTVDEPLEHLGETLSLPPFLEAQREMIEAGLRPLGLPV